MKLRELSEARANSARNPRRYTREVLINQLESIVDNHDYVAGVPNLFVNFSDVEKLGINPRREHTLSYLPLGIYAYPASWLVNQPELKHEFAARRPWANIFQVQGHVLNIATIAPSEAGQLLSQAKQLIRDLGWDDDITYQHADDTWVAKFHHLAAEYLAPLWNIHRQVAMHKLWQTMNVDAIVDPGTRLLARDIGAQLVVFNRKIIKNVEQIRNMYREPTSATGAQLIQTVISMLMPELNELNRIYSRDRSGWLQTVRNALAEFENSNHESNVWLVEKQLVKQFNTLLQAINPTEPESQLAEMVKYEMKKALRFAAVKLGLR